MNPGSKTPSQLLVSQTNPRAVVPGEAGADGFEDVDLHLQHPIAAPQLNQLIALGAGQSLLAASTDIALLHRAIQTRLADPSVLCDPENRLTPCDQVKASSRSPAALW